MGIQVRLACGHQVEVSELSRERPLCPIDGETRVTRTFARAPRFTGFCTGPHAETQAVEPFSGKLHGHQARD